MKYFATVLMLAAIGLVSCKKEYTCECNYSDGTTTATSSTTIKDTKKNATETCDQGDASTTIGGSTATWECEIK